MPPTSGFMSTKYKMWNMFKVNNKNTKTTSLTSSWCFIGNFEHISHLFSVSIADSEHVNVSWDDGFRIGISMNLPLMTKNMGTYF